MVDQTALHEPTTESVALYSFKFRRAEAHATIVGLAKRYGLEINSVEERRRWISLDICVTVTGDPFKIVNLREALSGREAPDPDQRWFDLAVGLLKALAQEMIEHFSW